MIDRRLGALGVEPPRAGQRGLFGRGLRDVWLAQGAGRIEGVRDGPAGRVVVLSRPGDEPYAFVHVRDRAARAADLKALGVVESGTRVTVPLVGGEAAAGGPVARARISARAAATDSRGPDASGLARAAGAHPGAGHLSGPRARCRAPGAVRQRGSDRRRRQARIIVRRAKEPLSQGFSRATRRGGLVIRSGRAAHETTLAGFEGRPGARHLYGEVVCEAIEQLQRDALDKPRPELVVKVDRSGLNQHHPIVERLYAAIDRVLRPIVAAEERRAGAHLIGAPRAVTARDQVGLRALNDLLKAAFDQPGSAGAQPGEDPAKQTATQPADGPSRVRRTTACPTSGAGAAHPAGAGDAAALVQAVTCTASPGREANRHPVRRPDARARRDDRRDGGRPRTVADAPHDPDPEAGRPRLRRPPSRTSAPGSRSSPALGWWSWRRPASTRASWRS